MDNEINKLLVVSRGEIVIGNMHDLARFKVLPSLESKNL